MATSMTPSVEGGPDPTTVAAPVAVRRAWLKRSAPMLTFVGQRLLSSVIVLLGATFIVYMLLAYAVDPLEPLRLSTDPNAPARMAELTAQLNLDIAPPIRYFMWLGNVLTGDLGASVFVSPGESVVSLLGRAIPTTVQLVAAATFLAIGLGILVGIVSALRQYTRFDYSVTFLSFVLFSLPSFWVAVLAKLWGAIGFNDFLADPSISWPVMLLIAVVSAVIWSAIIGGVRRTRLISAGASFVVTLGALLFLTQTDWIQRPVLGYAGVAVLGVGVAFGVTGLMAGLGNRRALYSALTAVAVGVALKFPLQFAFQPHVISWWLVALLALVAVVVGCAIGWFYGGYDRRVSMRIAAITSITVGAFILLDRFAQSWPAYVADSRIGFRPIRTIGSSTPAFRSDFWGENLNAFGHVILPTVTLILISFAAYTRYTRGSLLEVMNQDYIRTARAKGLPERVVTMRHAFRNALIPLATLIPLDIAGLFGGAIITETVFEWNGMGRLFISSLRAGDTAPIMGHFLLIGTLLVIASIVVDLIYAALDPRIRVNA